MMDAASSVLLYCFCDNMVQKLNFLHVYDDKGYKLAQTEFW
jgi:hypothetical protein